jgi:hypothetical protein
MWVGPLVEALALGSDVSVFLINTEGATDPVFYEGLVRVRPALKFTSRAIKSSTSCHSAG